MKKIYYRFQGPVSSGASTATGGSDESTSSSPGQGETDGDGDESDLEGESEDYIVTHVEPTRKISVESSPRLLYSWKEVCVVFTISHTLNLWKTLNLGDFILSLQQQDQ